MTKNYKGYILDFLECMRSPEGEAPPIERTLTFSQVVAEIDDGKTESDIIKLFQCAGLDHCSPNAWYTIVGFFADVLFNQKKLGRRPKWRKPRTLRRDFEQCLRRYPKRNGEGICKALKLAHPKKYSDIPATTILRWVGDAGVSIKELKRKLKRQATIAKVRRNSGRSFT